LNRTRPLSVYLICALLRHGPNGSADKGDADMALTTLDKAKRKPWRKPRQPCMYCCEPCISGLCNNCWRLICNGHSDEVMRITKGAPPGWPDELVVIDGRVVNIKEAKGLGK
jgi:hypothetical protein